MPGISALIIAYNEEAKIFKCISSLKNVADEILVVDSFSTDNTVEICKSMGVKVVQHPFNGYIEQKNYALTQAAFNMVLSLDADEILSEKLAASISEVKQKTMADGYTMNRLNNYCGKWIYHCGWYPDKKLRLFDKTKGHWGGMNPHDKFQMIAGAKTEHLEGDLLHYSYGSIDQHIRQTESFTSIAAKQLFARGTKPSVIKMYAGPFIKFIHNYFFRLGFLDGYYGFIISKISARYTFLKQKKLFQLFKA